MVIAYSEPGFQPAVSLALLDLAGPTRCKRQRDEDGFLHRQDQARLPRAGNSGSLNSPSYDKLSGPKGASPCITGRPCRDLQDLVGEHVLERDRPLRPPAAYTRSPQ